MKHPRTRLLHCLMAALLLFVAWPNRLSASERLSAGATAEEARKHRLSQNRYYTMKPFTLPLLDKGEVVEHFTLVIAMEITEEGRRPALAMQIPRIRDAMYRLLLRMVTFRRRASPIPDVDAFRARLRTVAINVAGSDLVKDILVQQAFRHPLR